MEHDIGRGSYKVHYGATDQPSSVKCGNWQPGQTYDLSWTDERKKVTCMVCQRRLTKQFGDKCE